MTVASLNHGDAVAQPLGDDVDGHAGRDQITREAPAHIVDTAPYFKVPHVCLKGLVEVIAVTPNSSGSNGVLAYVPTTEKAVQELRELFG